MICPHCQNDFEPDLESKGTIKVDTKLGDDFVKVFMNAFFVDEAGTMMSMCPRCQIQAVSTGRDQWLKDKGYE